jgi:hypothetical protein
MGNLMRNRIFLAIAFGMAATTSQVEAQDQVCANNCIKNYNACIAQCGGTRAAMPWEPVATDKLAKINECVSSQCRNPLNTCQGDCSKRASGAKAK